MDARENVEFLVRSSSRPMVLRALVEQPSGRAALAKRCDSSRSTIHRAIETFRERGWVEIDDGVCRVTPGGRCVLAGYESLIETIERVEEYESFLRRLDSDIPTDALADATVVASTPERPHRALRYFSDVVSTADFERFRGITPITSPMFESAHSDLLETGVSIEVVIDESVHKALGRTDAAVLRDADTRSGMELSMHSTALSFGLALLDNRVLVGAYDDRGNLCECLDGENRRLRQWAEDIYNSHRERARSIGALSAE